jgi:hypothetical protein
MPARPRRAASWRSPANGKAGSLKLYPGWLGFDRRTLSKAIVAKDRSAVGPNQREGVTTDVRASGERSKDKSIGMPNPKWLPVCVSAPFVGSKGSRAHPDPGDDDPRRGNREFKQAVWPRPGCAAFERTGSWWLAGLRRAITTSCPSANFPCLNTDDVASCCGGDVLDAREPRIPVTRPS